MLLASAPTTVSMDSVSRSRMKALEGRGPKSKSHEKNAGSGTRQLRVTFSPRVTKGSRGERESCRSSEGSVKEARGGR